MNKETTTRGAKLPPRARIYVSGRLVYEIYGYRDETVDELRERAEKALLISVSKD